ncbi:FtsX-like permease family protein [Streptomyces echinatus]
MGRPVPRPATHRPAPAAAPWVRTRLRAAPGAAAALALLVALASCLAGAFPRAVDRYEDAGLRRALRQAGPDHTTLRVSLPQPDLGLPPGQRAAAMRPAALERQYRKVLGTVGGPLAVDREQSAYGVGSTVSRAVPDPWLPRPTGLPAQVSLAAQSGLAGHARVRGGRLPRAPHPVDGTTREVEAAVTAATAQGLHIRVGSVVHVPAPGRPPLAVRVTGILVPRDPGGAYWSTVPLLRTPSLVTLPTPGPDPDKYWLGALLLAPEAAPALLGTSTDPARYWHLAPDPRALHAHDLDRLRPAVAALESGPALQRVRAVTGDGADIGTDLDDTLASFSPAALRHLAAGPGRRRGHRDGRRRRPADGGRPGRRPAPRRTRPAARARGAGLSGLAGRLLAETAVAAVPAGALGLAVALVAVPAGRTGPAVAAALATVLAGCAALPVRAAFAHRTVRLTAVREDVTSVRPSRRRTVAELTLLVLAVGAVATLRRRGTSGDQLVAVAPVLIGVIAALLLLRLHPLLLRRLSGPAGRLRGAIGHLSLARAGRAQASAVLPLLALLTALTTAAFGGSVLAGVAGARDRAALLTVGADARADSAAPLPADLPARVRAVPGVGAATAVSIAHQAEPANGQDAVPLVGVDPDAYGELTARTGPGAFPADRLAGRSGTLAAVASPSVASAYGTRRSFPVRLEDGSSVTVRIVLVRDRTPAVPGPDFLVVNRAGPRRRGGPPHDPPGDRRARGRGRAAPCRRGRAAAVRTRAEERARYADSPLQTGAEHVYTAAVAAGAGFAVLALLLALLRAAPERGRAPRPPAHDGPHARGGPPSAGPGIPPPGPAGRPRGRPDRLGRDPSALPRRRPDGDRPAVRPGTAGRGRAAPRHLVPRRPGTAGPGRVDGASRPSRHGGRGDGAR